MNSSLKSITAIANQLYEESYKDAEVLFLSGSVVRGEHTKTSDLDLVVLYKTLPNAYRESYYYQDWPIEAFVHDYQTLHYFFDKVDRPSGVPSLMQMVSEGIEIPEQCVLSVQAKKLAEEYLVLGPPVWGREDLDKSRYGITQLMEDLRGATDEAEKQAIIMSLNESFVDHYLRSRQRWSGKGKWIPRRLREADSGFAERYFEMMKSAFCRGEIQLYLELVERELAKEGGELFEGFRLTAPSEWRMKDIQK